MDIFDRSSLNPIITPADIEADDRFEVIGAFNPAAVLVRDVVKLVFRVALRPKEQEAGEVWAPVYDSAIGDYRMLKKRRADVDDSDPRFFMSNGEMYLTSVSEFYEVDLDSNMKPVGKARRFMAAADDSEAYGIEDPRITLIDGFYYILYTAVSKHGQAVALARTSDFETVERRGIVLPPNNKDCVLFPRLIEGRYHMIHRPTAGGVPKPEMWHTSSPDLISWGPHRFLASPGDRWESGRIGAGGPPVETDEGWLLFYHGADPKHYYRMGVMLLDLQKPWKIKWRSQEPFFEPVEKYEKKGFFGDVVFGTAIMERDDRLFMFYGASDTTCCVASVKKKTLLSEIRSRMS